MRERKTWLVVTFHTTAAAIGMEKLCAARGLAGRLIPVPRALTADCGMAWRAGTEDRASCRNDRFIKRYATISSAPLKTAASSPIRRSPRSASSASGTARAA